MVNRSFSPSGERIMLFLSLLAAMAHGVDAPPVTNHDGVGQGRSWIYSAAAGPVPISAPIWGEIDWRSARYARVCCDPPAEKEELTGRPTGQWVNGLGARTG